MLTVNSSNIFEITVTNPLLDPTNVDDATVNLTITDSAGSEIAGVSWPQLLVFVSGGLYRKTLTGLVLDANEIYTETYSITSGSLTRECVINEKAESGGCC